MRAIFQRVLIALFALSAVLPSLASAATPAEAARQLREFLDRVPAGPGYAVVVVDRDQALLEYVRGERNALSGASLTLDTPMYVASQTKAYMGLLAQILDRRGVLDLDDTLAQHWPDLVLPAGVDPAKWTLRDLLNHRVPIVADEVTMLEAYIGAPDPTAYPDLLARFAKAREPGFRYDNLGYNVYAAILYQATGKRWQDWLRDEVFVPLRLHRTSARTSDFVDAELSSGHVWRGDAAGWEAVAPKPDALMQSAGGVFTSPGDMGRWLRFQLGSPAAGLDAALLEAAHARGADIDPGAPNAYDLPCDGYAQGWNLCDFQGHRVYIHGGTYDGTRSLMAFAPDLGVGIGAFSNSDNMTGWLTSRTVLQYLQFLVGDPTAPGLADARVGEYPARTAKLLASRRTKLAEARADPAWRGWNWAPGLGELHAYAGRYRAPGFPAALRIVGDASGATLRLGELQRRLRPASPDLFGATWRALDPPEPVRFLRDEAGAVSALEYQGLRFSRDADP